LTGSWRLLRAGSAVAALLLAVTCAPSKREGAEGGNAADEHTENPITTVRDSAGVRVVEVDAARARATCAVSTDAAVTIGSAAGDEPSQLYEVYDGNVLSDGRIAVLNAGTEEVRIFSADGVFQSRFGRRGEGPGEFRSLYTLDVLPGDTLVVGDYRPWRFSIFTAEGEHLQTVVPQPPIPDIPEVISVAPDGAHFLLGSACCRPEAHSFVTRTVDLIRYDRDGPGNGSARSGDTLGTFRYDRTGWLSSELRFLGSPVFEASAAFAATPDGWVHAPGDRRVLELRAPDGALQALVRWTGRDRAVTRTELEAYRARIREVFAERSSRLRPYAEARTDEDRPVADRFPAHDGLLVGQQGRIWLRLYRRPLDEGERRWLVFGPDGSFRCHALSPRGTRVMSVGPGHLLGTRADELGVESVVLHRLGPPRDATDTGAGPGAGAPLSARSTPGCGPHRSCS
jgi:hypothetical protein